MAEKIGLEAVFDMFKFNSGISKYMDAIGKAHSTTEKAAGGMGKAWTDLGGTATKAAAVLGGAIVAASAAAGAAVAGFVVGGINKAADLEEGLSRVAAALNITMEQVGPLKELINNLGLDPNLKVTAVEAAQAIENLAKNGLSMQQILDGAARSTVLLANATGADFGQAADIATDVMQQFNIEAKDMNEVVNGITAVTNLSKFSIDDYALALAQGGGVAASVGVEFEDFNTTIAAISPLFASGSDAGTALKTMLLRLAPSTAPATEAMGELGLMTFDTQKALKMLAEAGIKPASESFDDILTAMMQYYGEAYKVDMTTQKGVDAFGKWSNEVDLMSNAFFDANGNLKSMAEISAILNEATKDLTEEEKNHYMNTIFGTDAMRAAFATAESGTVIYTDAALAAKELGVSQDEVNKVIAGGVTQFEALQLQMGLVDANEQAKTRMDNFKGALEILKGVIEAVQIQIGDAFLPILTELAKQFTALASQYGPMVVAYFQSLATSISDLIRYVGEFITTGQPFNQFFANLSPTLQSVVLGIGAFVLIVQQASDLIANSIGRFVEWKDVLIVLGAAIATTVIPAIAGMVVAMAPVIAVFAGAVLAVAALRTAWEKDFLGIKTATVTAFDAMKGAIQPLTDAIKEFGPGALTELKAWATGNETEFTNVKAIWEGAKTAAGNLFQGVVGFATSNLPGWQAKLVEWGTAAGQWLTDASGTIGAKLTEWYTALSTEVTNKLPAWKATLLTWRDAAWQWLVDAAGQVGAKLTEWYTALSTEITNKLPAWKSTLLTWRDAAWQWLVDAAGQVGAKITEWYTALSTGIEAKLPLWRGILTAWTIEAGEWLIGAKNQIPAKLTEWYTTLSTEVNNKLPAWKSTLLTWRDAAWQWIVDAAGLVSSKITEWYAQLRSAVEEKLPIWKTALLNWANAAWQWIVDAAGKVTTQIGVWYTNLSTALSGKLATWKTALVAWATAAWQWIVDAAGQVAAKVTQWYTALKTALDSKLPAWRLAFFEWTKAIGQWLVDAVTALPAQISSWYTGLKTEISAKLPTFKTEMLKFATAMVTWIGSSAADALPELGKWLGKLLAWIPLAVIGLAAGLVKMAGALVGWIAGGEGTTENESAAGQTDEAMEQFKAALLEALINIKKGFIEGVQAFVTEWQTTMNEYVDWNQLGQDILNKVREGWEAVRDAVYNGVTLMVERMVDLIFETDWKQLGKDIIDYIRDGISSMASRVINEMGKLAKDAAKKVYRLRLEGTWRRYYRWHPKGAKRCRRRYL